MRSNPSGCYVVDSDFNVIYVNEAAQKEYPRLVPGKKCYACQMGLDHPCDACPVAKDVEGPHTYTDPVRDISRIVDTVQLDIPGIGRCHTIILPPPVSASSLSATLPTSASELQSLALIKALTSNYYDVFSVNLKTDRMTMFRLNGKPLGDDSVYRDIPSYTKGIQEYIHKYVYTEDQEMTQEKFSLDYLKDVLSRTEFVIIHYRVFWNNEIRYFFRKVARAGDAESFQNIVVGIGCEDDIVRERKASAQLQDNLRKMEHSVLTGLLNRQAFFLHGTELLQSHPEKSFDFCVFRVDNLSFINHHFGRIAGDQIIRLIGEILQTYQQEFSCFGYLGGGVFSSLTQNASTEVRAGNIRQFRDRILEASIIKDLSLKWSLYSSISRDIPLESVYEKTEFAISTIRASMHQEYVEFDQAMLDRLDWDRNVEKSFQEALDNGEFTAWFQPKYNVRSREIVGAEALVRWVRPDGEIIPPSKFIPILENCGMIHLLDKEIFRQTCQMQQTLARRGLQEIPISVNLSRASIHKGEMAQSYSEIAAFYGVKPRLIPIEITESAAVRAAMIRDFTNSLIQYGFVLHMDDFGSGFSSLVSLQTLPFACIKLDKSLVDFIGQQSGESLLKHTIACAKESGMTVVAEGVETMEQYMFLKVAGCDAIQGYYFSKPVCREDFLQMLK